MEGPGDFLDRHNRSIDYLRVSITGRCNLRCVYCVPEGDERAEEAPPEDVLDTGELIRTVQAAVRLGVSKVRLTGGEPLLRPDLLKLVSGLKATGLRELGLTTNGLLLAPLARDLKRAGLDRVNISLDTLRPDRYRELTRGRAEVEEVWQGIEAAEKAGLSPVKINVVLLRGINEDEVGDFARLTYQRDFHVRFIELMPVGRRLGWDPAQILKAEEVKQRAAAFGILRKLRFRGGDGPSRNYQYQGARGVLGFISPVSDHFCSFCNRLRLTSTGKLKPCLLSKEEIDILGAIRRGATDREIEELFFEAVGAKPEGHGLDRRGKADLDGIDGMKRIGG